MITIYSTSPIFFWDFDVLDRVCCLTEERLLDLVKENKNAIWFVSPHGDSVFRRMFIEGHFDDNGYIIEGFYWTELCGERVDYRLIEDGNFIMNRKNEEGR